VAANANPFLVLYVGDARMEASALEVGLVEGCVLGWALGCIEGWAAGFPDGCELGCALGERRGREEG
jgi:hypothetical protein